MEKAAHYVMVNGPTELLNLSDKQLDDTTINLFLEKN